MNDYRFLAARWILPISREPLNNGVVVMSRHNIVDVLSRDELAQKYPRAVTTDYGDAVIVPGFINLHTHIDYTSLRLFDTTSNFFQWIRGLVARARHWQPEQFMNSALEGAVEIAQSGTTCVADSSFTGVACSTALARVGLRGVVGMELFGLDYTRAEKCWSEWLDKFHALENNPDPLLLEAFESERIKLTVAPHTPYTVSPHLWAKAAEWAQGRNVPLLGHLSESPHEVRWISDEDEEATAFLSAIHHSGIPGQMPPTPWRGHGRTPTEHMKHHGLLNDGLIAAHAVQLSEHDIELLSAQKTKVAHCPRSNSRLQNGAARFTALSRAGVQLGFGTDSAASVDDLDVLAEARFAVNLHRTRDPDYRFDSGDFIRRLTLGAAEILGIEAAVGSLDPGKEADLGVFDIDPRASYAFERPYDLLLYGNCCLRDLFVAGRQVIKSGEITTLAS